MIIATQSGIFLWPGTPLVYRQGEGFFLIGRQEITNKIACFFGPNSIYCPIISVLEAACDGLRGGHTEATQRSLDRLGLPGISPNGWRVIKAISQRLNLPLPGVFRTDRQIGSIWDDAYIERIAALYDQNRNQADVLAKIFNPAGEERPAALRSKLLAETSGCGCDCTGLRKYNFNQNEPRDQTGRWVGGQDGNITSQRSLSRPDVQLAQELVLPELIPRPIPIPLPPYQPGLEISPFLETPQTAPRDAIPQNPYPDRPECAEEWKEATSFCMGLQGRRLLGKGPYRNMGKTVWECILGQVSSDCGGSGLQA